MKQSVLFWVLTFILLSCGMGVAPQFSGVEVPSVNGVSTRPNPDGTVTVTISGSGFVNGSTVTINNESCTPVTVISPTQLTCILPNGQIALVNIVITTPSGGSSGGNGEGTSGGGSAFHTLFVTSTKKQTGNISGLSGGDAYCQGLGSTGSKTASVTGTWRAVLSISGTNAKDRITFVLGASVKNTNGETLLGTASSLWSGGSLQNPVLYDENGTAQAGNVWTGTLANGTSSGTDCEGWTSSSGPDSGGLGSSASQTSTWLNSGVTNSCHHAGGGARVYCINSND